MEECDRGGGGEAVASVGMQEEDGGERARMQGRGWTWGAKHVRRAS